MTTTSMLIFMERDARFLAPFSSKYFRSSPLDLACGSSCRRTGKALQKPQSKAPEPHLSL